MLQLPRNRINVLPPGPVVVDSTLDRIRRHRELCEQSLALGDLEDKMCSQATKTHGREPFALIAWRNYSAIGLSGIEDCRRELLAFGINPDVVQQEYLDAKRRYQERDTECRRWQKKAGVNRLKRKLHSVIEERRRILESFADDPPTSSKGASALIQYILEHYDGCDFDERATRALRGVAQFLSSFENEEIS